MNESLCHRSFDELDKDDDLRENGSHDDDDKYSYVNNAPKASLSVNLTLIIPNCS